MTTERALKKAIRELAGWPSKRDINGSKGDVALYIQQAINAATPPITDALRVVQSEWTAMDVTEIRACYRYKDVANWLKGVLLVIQAMPR